MDSKSTILIVDDIPTNLELLLDFLSDYGFEVLVAVDGEGALEQIHYAKPDVILLDVMMPGIDGFETCRRLKENIETANIPVIFMTALSETVDKIQGFQLGAVDYITKPLQQEEVLARVNTHLNLQKLQQQLQRTNETLEQKVAERTSKLAEAIALLQEQINERNRTEQALRSIVEGTATATGRHFLQSLVHNLATTLDVSKAMITECVNVTKSRLRTLAYWHNGHFHKNIEYHTHQTPCERVIAGEFVYIGENLQHHYPQEVGIESFIGIPLRSQENEILGHLAVFHEKPMLKESLHLQIIKIFAARAGAELERKQVEEYRQDAIEELRQSNQAYSRFVPKEFLRLLNLQKITDVQLGDQIQMEMTILFSDIRDFTLLSETMSPQDNFNFINAYLRRVSPLIRKCGGFIDKYIGDAIMALFPGRVDDAICAAIAMHQEVITYNKQREFDGFSPIRIGIGLHTGNLMLGTIGESERMEGTVISDAVNLASRLEGLTKNYEASIMMSEQTLLRLENSDLYHFRFLDLVQVKGKTEAVSVFELFDGDLPEMAEAKQKSKSIFEQGLLIYHDRDFEEARSYFEQVLEDNPTDKAAQIYIQRIDNFLKNGGPPADWNGIEMMRNK